MCQTFWRQTRAQYESPELRFENLHMMPKPLRPEGVPIWVGGSINPRVVTRLARFGTGWIPWGPDAADLARAIPRMRAALREAGRDPSDLQVVGRPALHHHADGTLDIARTMADVPPLLAAGGVTDVRLNVRVPEDESAALEHLSAITARFRATVSDHLSELPSSHP
ncbi:hypothetical protein GCM10023196_045410 [Actinoallomurus vinaceus]|uniref:Luciferase-like domain-containing protein n=1 Tax=Actinoallomurus vinaceus TaxID=1080074 RepID=A0ABP8UFA1_9ACTN